MMMRMGAVMRKVVCLLAWLSVGQVSGSYLPQDMNRTLQDLLQHYKISKSDIYDGKHVFPKEELKGKMESQMLFMGGVLEAYDKLFGHMLKGLPTPSPLSATSGDKADTSGPSTAEPSAAGDTRFNLIKVLQKIKELKRHSYQEQLKILHGLQKLKHIEMDNIKVQGKALWELPWIYEKANSLADNVMRRRRRRRRQTRTGLAREPERRAKGQQ
ncbi:interferon gamma 1-like [Xiphophorus hellerii]|uniref:interferon gamma 1-like n=1 Tax=Xiphophorus hellerii TaxID=8084 RepID=UPI0013B396FE|nr:interferon gamma 1-like [Xiphophorus hellerii]